MISVVIPTLNAERSLPRCFESLIPAVVRGVVREVVVADGGSGDGTLAIADAAGAHIVRAGRTRAAQMAQGSAQAKGEWLLFLYPDTALGAGWEIETESFLERTTLERPMAAAYRYAIDGFGHAPRRDELLAAFRCSMFGLPYGEQGLLVSKRLYQRVGGHRDVAMDDIDLVRRIGRRRLVMFRARALIQPQGESFQRRSLALTALHALRVPKRVVALLGG